MTKGGVNVVIGDFRKIENSYIENFSRMEDRGDHIIFWDERLPDMYAFNCTVVKENFSKSLIESFVEKEVVNARSSGRDFLKIIFYPEIEISKNTMEHFTKRGFEVQTNIYMKLIDSRVDNYKGNEECTVIRAASEKEFEDTQNLDVEASIDLGMPADFSLRKSLRKKEVFQQKDTKLLSYLCYYKSMAIGKCEMHLEGDFAKIEDFDVLQSYRKMGFGTAMLKKMISEALDFGKKYIYLITDKDDTPRFMYEKLGFEIIGEETELFWSRKG